MSSEINFTKQSLAKIPTPDKKKRIYKRDSKEKGLALCKTHTGKISFYLRKMIDSKDSRVLIGHYPDLSIENARKKSLSLKGQIADGGNPQKEREKLKQEITFGKLWLQYMNLHSKPHKKSWQEDEDYYKRHLKGFESVKISNITRSDIENLKSEVSNKNGIFVANKLLAIISVVFNKAIQWGFQGDNPANNIKKFKEKSRSRFLKSDELPKFFEALEKEENDLFKDFFYVAIFTGIRKSNILAIKWQDIDFDQKILYIPDSKNGEPQDFPLSDQVIEILKNRKIINKKLELKDYKKNWVFPSKTSKSGHLEEPKSAWRRIKERSGINDIRIHDLRRSLGSWQAINGASLPIIGKSLNQKSIKATQIYARLSNDPVRESVNKTVDTIIEVGGMK
jgi:integrase